MAVQHSTPNALDLNIEDVRILLNRMFELAEHGGIGQFRVGRFSVLDTDESKVVVFATALPDASYEVLLQPLGDLGGTYWVTDLTPEGFTARFSSGATIDYSYFAVAR